MIPSSSGSNNPNQIPERRSARRNESKISNEKSSPKANFYTLSEPKKTISMGYWINKSSYWFFTLKKQIAPTCKNILQSKSEECFQLLKDCICCAISMSSEPILSSSDLLLTISSLLEQDTIHDICLSLFTSNFANKLIGSLIKAPISTSRIRSTIFFSSIFSRFMAKIKEMVNYIHYCINLNGLITKNFSKNKLQDGISASISVNFKTKDFVLDHSTGEFLFIVLSHLGNPTNIAAQKAKNSLLNEAVTNVCCFMQLVTNQACLLLLNEKNVPTTTEDIFSCIENHSKTKVVLIEELNYLSYWDECLFVSLARLFLSQTNTILPEKSDDLVKFLREKFPYVGKIRLSPRKNKERLTRSISYSLIVDSLQCSDSSSAKLHKINLLEINCNRLEQSFLHLKKLLFVLWKNVTIGNFDYPINKTREAILLDFFDSFNDQERQQIISKAFFSTNPILKITENKNIQTFPKDYSESAPLRSSKVQSSKQNLLTDQSKSTLHKCFTEKISYERSKECSTIKSHKRKASESDPFVKNKLPNLNFIFPSLKDCMWSICYPNLGEAIELLKNIMINSLIILIDASINYETLSPKEVLENSLDIIGIQKFIPNAILEANCGWEELANAKNELFKQNHTYKLIEEVSKEINENMCLLCFLINSISSAVKQKARSSYLIEDTMSLQRLKFASFLISLFVDLSAYQLSKESLFMQGIILSILQETSEESNPLHDMSNLI